MRRSLLYSLLGHTLFIAALIALSLTSQGKGEDGDKEGSKTKGSQEVEVTIVPNIPGQSASKCLEWYGGIGVFVTWNEDNDEVISGVVEGYPADLAGLKNGDTFLDHPQVQGEVGTSVTIKVRRLGGQVRLFTLKREKICTEKT